MTFSDKICTCKNSQRDHLRGVRIAVQTRGCNIYLLKGIYIYIYMVVCSPAQVVSVAYAIAFLCSLNRSRYWGPSRKNKHYSCALDLESALENRRYSICFRGSRESADLESALKNRRICGALSRIDGSRSV